MADLVKGEKYVGPAVQQKWHSNCELVYHSTGKKGIRKFWCDAHGQWAYQYPTEVIYKYDWEHKLVNRGRV